MKITTVRITDEQHHWIKSNRPQQLSNIVREHLDDLMHRDTPVNYHNAWRESAQKCYPHMRGGYCSICWPAGIPSKVEWSEYIKSGHRGSMAGNVQSIAATMTFEEWTMLRHGDRQTSLEDWNGDVDLTRLASKKNGTIKKSSWIRRLLFKES